MRFVSTRGQAPAVTLSQALAAGLAPDGGLYLPATLPRLSARDFDAVHTLPEIASRLLSPFFEGDALAAQLPAICHEAFDFELPCQPLPLEHTWLLELFHGPTAAFKDFGARFLASCLRRIPRSDARPLTILVATSGDTGAAVGAAFHDVPGIRVRILYPDGRVSPRQAHQLGAFGGNVEAYCVAGSFDECQALVKQALNDADLQARCPLSSANSISLGRLLPQMSYYACAALQHWRETGRELGFIVPTGNLGNALAALLVRKLGLPVGALQLACNANDVLPRFFSGEAYTPQTSIATLANAMDVGTPSNFERLRALYPDESALRADLDADTVDDDTIRATLRSAPALIGTGICPHTATALAVLQRQRADGDQRDYAIVATAHPAKFDTVLADLLDSVPEPPPALAELLARDSHATPLAVDYDALCDVLSATDPIPPSDDASGTAAPTPRFATPSAAPRAPSGLGRGRWWALCLVLSAALALQVLLADRQRLAADPAWRPALQALCGTLGCALPPWRETARLRVVSREARPHPQAADALELLLTFRNDAPYPQAWPILEVAFTDIDGRRIAQRRFQPSEYLDAPGDGDIAVGQSVQARLALVDPGKSALAFELEFH